MNTKQRDVIANGLVQIATAAIATLTFGEMISGRNIRFWIVILGVVATGVLYWAAYAVEDIVKS